MESKVSIILLNYNTTDDAIQCINSLLKIDYGNYDIIIVDNMSKDDEYDRLNKYIQNIEKCSLIRSKENRGFAYGNNIGIKYAIDKGCDYVLLLNCDTEVERNFLSELIKPIKKNEELVAISIGKIKYFHDKKKLWYAGGEIKWNNYIGIHFGEGEKDIGQYDEEKEITFATGCCMLINCRLDFNFFLPEEYFMYYEDVDFCANVLGNGYKIVYSPKSVIYHKVGGSSGGEQSSFTLRWSNRGRLIFMNKYKNRVSKLSFNYIKIKFYFTRFFKIIYLLLKFEKDKAKSIYYGTKDGIRFQKKYKL